MMDRDYPSRSSPRRVAQVAGAAYLVQYVLAASTEFFLRPALIVSGDAARTAANIAAHGQLFRATILLDLLTGAVVILLNVALYELLAPVNRSLARLAAFWRVVEVAVGSAIAVFSFIVLSLLGGADHLRVFETAELQGLAQVFVAARAAGFNIVLLFFALGSTTYMYLLGKSRYVHKALAAVGVVGSAFSGLYAVARMLLPTHVAAALADIRQLPLGGLILVAIALSPLLLFEFAVGLWLLAKGGRIDREGAA